MTKLGFVSEFMNGGRILAKGQITDLSNGFELPGGLPFSIYVRPKVSSTDLDVVVDVTAYQEEVSGDAPFVLNDWSPLAIVAISPDNELLDQYDIYWGAGCYIDKSLL